MIIRTAAEADLPDILELYAQPGMDDGKILSPDDAKTIYAKIMSYPDYELYVAEEDGTIVGAFALLIMDNLAHTGSKSAVIEDVAVTLTRQGRGVGTQMMKRAAEICKSKACYKISLSSNMKRADAHEFYKKLGYKIHGYSFLTEI